MKARGFTDRSLFEASPAPGHPHAPRPNDSKSVVLRVKVLRLMEKSVRVHLVDDAPGQWADLPLSLVKAGPGLLSRSQRENRAVPITLPRWKAEQAGLAAGIVEGQGRLF